MTVEAVLQKSTCKRSKLHDDKADLTLNVQAVQNKQDERSVCCSVFGCLMSLWVTPSDNVSFSLSADCQHLSLHSKTCTWTQITDVRVPSERREGKETIRSPFNEHYFMIQFVS